jgi:hypothetical protein
MEQFSFCCIFFLRKTISQEYSIILQKILVFVTCPSSVNCFHIHVMLAILILILSDFVSYLIGCHYLDMRFKFNMISWSSSCYCRPLVLSIMSVIMLFSLVCFILTLCSILSYFSFWHDLQFDMIFILTWLLLLHSDIMFF